MRFPQASKLITLAILFYVPIVTCAQEANDTTNSYPERWWKGNLHTHSLWSDGDDFPEMIAHWYAGHGYNFLALSDHNILSEGMKWMKYDAILSRAEPDVLEKYRKVFGKEWVETRGTQGAADYEVRLKPLDEFGPLLNRANEFILIPGEEISDRGKDAQGVSKPVHMNATNLRNLISPMGGETVREAMQNNLRAVLEQEKEIGREILPHLNHPNFGYAVTAEDLAYVIQEQFFEVYNGHPSVNQEGDEQHLSIERMWDVANAIRICKLDAEPLLGVATDDSHEYHTNKGATTGRGWVMVQSRYLSPEHLIKAMKQGKFYASSGVSLSRIHFNSEQRELELEIVAEPGTTYTTEFIGILEPAESGQLPSDEQIGKVLFTSQDLNPSFKCPEDVLMVRARVESSKVHPNPSLKDQRCQAWTQPIVLEK